MGNQKGGGIEYISDNWDLRTFLHENTVPMIGLTDQSDYSIWRFMVILFIHTVHVSLNLGSESTEFYQILFLFNKIYAHDNNFFQMRVFFTFLNVLWYAAFSKFNKRSVKSTGRSILFTQTAMNFEKIFDLMSIVIKSISLN